MGKLPFKKRPGSKRFKRTFTNKLRKNNGIRVPEVRVIGPDGKQIGVIPTREAQALAKKHQLDLVEVSPGTKPPVCRILDFGKYMYELSKKQKESKTTTSKLKEVKFRINIDTGDYMTKLRRAEMFLFKGNKLKISLMFRGREMQHKDLGMEIVVRTLRDLAHMGHADAEPRSAGRNISVTLSPLAVNQRKLKYTAQEEDAPKEDSEN